MNPHSNKNIGTLRKLASSLGITMASRKKKDELLSLIADREKERQAAEAGTRAFGSYGKKRTEAEKAELGQRKAGSMTRAERDALKATPVTIFDPGHAVTRGDLRSRRGFARFERRHSIFQTKTLGGVVQTHVRNIPAHLRREGVMVPATRRDLMEGRIREGVSAFGPVGTAR